jgi:hypothetical protein
MAPESSPATEPEGFAPLHELAQSLLLIGMLLAPIGVTLSLALVMVKVLAG